MLSPSTSAQPCRRFSLEEIQSATNNFDDKLVIGEGGFGKVYKGRITIEERSHFVAIKRCDYRSDQGASEFRAEIEMLSKLRHCHLVSLYGFCDVEKEMILVYEYMPNGTLFDHLHKAATPLTWVQRLKIGIGAARGLDYLHTGFGTHQGVIHRDVKSSNILLDENWEAMISDFGLSKIGPTNQSLSYIEASVKGTFGYLDPEYFYTRKLTRKSDVYSFGVVLFELLSGRLSVDTKYGEEECSLVRWAQKCVKERKVDQMVDSSMSGIFPKCVRQFAQIAYPCLSSVPKERPTMTEVVGSLQALLKEHAKLEISAVSSGTTGLTSMMHKYFGLSPKLISPKLNYSPKLNTDHVGTSKSGGDNMTIKDADVNGSLSNGSLGLAERFARTNETEDHMPYSSRSPESRTSNRNIEYPSEVGVKVKTNDYEPAAVKSNVSTPLQDEEKNGFKPRSPASAAATTTAMSATTTNQVEAEWIEQYEPGVYITLLALHDGTRDLKRVRFSRRRFVEHQAETWWSENREQVYERYNVRGSSKSLVSSLNP